MSPADASGHGDRTNALVGWSLTGVVVLAAVESARTGAVLWAGFALVVAVAVALPAAATRDWTTVVPWPVVAFAAVAMIVRAVGRYPEAAGYAAVTALAQIAVVELDSFTNVTMSRRFAVGFSVLTTMAIQSLWTVAQFYSDRWLRTDFLRSQTELQWDLVVVTAVSVVVGGALYWYFGRISDRDAREEATV